MTRHGPGSAGSDPLRLAVLFPELLGTYGDGGNVVVLRQRLAWRGRPVQVVDVRLDDPVPEQCDLYVLGGGEDRAQAAALAALRRYAGLRRAVDRGATVFAVCAGLQVLGQTLHDRTGKPSAGLGLLDVDTWLGAPRLVGEVVAHPNPGLDLPEIQGFANHAGRTALGPGARPLARVVTGPGNGGVAARRRSRLPCRAQHPDPLEGAVQGSVVATYLHGPVLARNPALADLLLGRALGQQLEPLEHAEELALRRDRVLRGRRPGRQGAGWFRAQPPLPSSR